MEQLEIKNLVIDYGIIRAIKGVSMKVPKGHIVAIIRCKRCRKNNTH